MKAPSADKVIVIGPTGEWETRTVSHVFEPAGFKLRICPTVYAAAAELAQGSVLLVVGTARTLARDNASLIALAEAAGVTCCCLLDSSTSLTSDLMERLTLGNVALCHRTKLRAWLEQYLTRSRRPACPGRHDKGGTTPEPLVSRAEQAALLGGYGDA